MFTEKDNLILWYLNYTNIDITDKKVYELSSKYNIPMQIFLKKLVERLKNVTDCESDKIMNILQVDMNLNLSNESYIFVKDFILNLDKIDLIDINSNNSEQIKKTLKLFHKLDIIPKQPPTHIGQPMPDPDLGRPYIDWLECEHQNCHKKFNTDKELIKHLIEFKVYTPSYHKLHEDIINEMKLTEDLIKNINIKKCPSWICKESEFSTPDGLIEHFKRLGIEPFWKKGMDLSKKEEYNFNKEIKIYDSKNCIICLDRKTNIIFDKCMHQCYCVECYDECIKLNNTLKCPLCRNFYNKIYPV
jgi:hypothetical protein